ncbi:MAG: hypothetical protein RI580_13355 [Halothece sp. Uz-M2-17]|nr:hypothetical protein [Halothece sp. Uz-M2-17]
MRRKIIGVMGSGTQTWSEFTIPLAQWIAHQGYHLLTGGGQGVMQCASEAFCQVEDRAGLCLGIIPTESDPEYGYVAEPDYPNPWVELPILSPLGRFTGTDKEQLSRNHINILTSNLIVALPGSKGTRNEVELALSYRKPVVLFGTTTAFEDFPSQVKQSDSLTDIVNFIKETLTVDWKQSHVLGNQNNIQ